MADCSQHFGMFVFACLGDNNIKKSIVKKGLILWPSADH